MSGIFAVGQAILTAQTQALVASEAKLSEYLGSRFSEASRTSFGLVAAEHSSTVLAEGRTKD